MVSIGATSFPLAWFESIAGATNRGLTAMSIWISCVLCLAAGAFLEIIVLCTLKEE